MGKTGGKIIMKGSARKYSNISGGQKRWIVGPLYERGVAALSYLMTNGVVQKVDSELREASEWQHGHFLRIMQ